MGHNTNTRSRRPNPLLLIGIGLVAVIVIILVIVVSLPKKDSSQNHEADGSSLSVAQAFDNYTKIYLGEVDFSKVYQLSMIYPVDEAYEQSDKNFFDKAKNSLNALVTATKTSANSDLIKMVEDYAALYDFVVLLAQNPIPTDDEVQEMYLKDGDGTTIDNINIAFAPIESAPCRNSNEVAAAQKAYLVAIVEKMKLYDSYGCVKADIGLDEICFARKTTIAEVKEASEKYTSAVQGRKSLDYFVELSKRELWSINQKIKGETNNV